MWSSDPFKYERKSLTGVLGLGHVLRWLNCDVAERVPLRLILISDDAEAPANPANRHFLIVAHKLTDKLRFQVFDDKGGMVEEYDEKELLAASQSGKEGWLTGLRKRRLLNRLRNQLEPLWQRGSPSADLTKSVIDLLVKIAGDRFVPFAYVDPRTKKALDGKGYDPQHQFDKSQKAPYTPPVGAGVNIAIINLVVFGLSWYLYAHVILAMCSSVYLPRPPIVWLAIMIGALAVITASTVISLLERLRNGPTSTRRQRRLPLPSRGQTRTRAGGLCRRVFSEATDP